MVGLIVSTAGVRPVPLRLDDAVPPVVAETVRVPDLPPPLVGENVTEIEHEAVPASVIPLHPSVEIANSVEPETALVSALVGAPPVLVTVNAIGVPDMFCCTDPKSRVAGAIINAPGATAIPVSDSIFAPPVVALADSVELLLPVVVGANLTWMVQLAPAARGLAPEQSPVPGVAIVKSVPVAAIVTALVACCPPLWSTKVCDELLLVTMVPKSVDAPVAGLSESAAAESPFPVIDADPIPPGLALAVSVAPLFIAAVAGLKATPTKQLAPAGSVGMQLFDAIPNSAASVPVVAATTAASAVVVPAATPPPFAIVNV